MRVLEGEVLAVVAGEVTPAVSSPAPVPVPAVPLAPAPAVPDDALPARPAVFEEPVAAAVEGSVPGTMLDEPKPFSERSADSDSDSDFVLVLAFVFAPVDPEEGGLFPDAAVFGPRRFGAASLRA